jgi:hypothetical protein
MSYENNVALHDIADALRDVASAIRESFNGELVSDKEFPTDKTVAVTALSTWLVDHPEFKGYIGDE